MNVLVLGDQIEDVYRHFTATRLCPEGPVPVLVKTKATYSTPGGAGLVAAQLRALLSDEEVVFIPGTHSVKERIFADDRLMIRMDDDKKAVADRSYLNGIDFSKFQAIVVSDYGKGSLDHSMARQLILTANQHQIPVFVDAKNSWDAYWGCFAMFPNKTEQNYHNLCGTMAKHVVNKLGLDGCQIDGIHIPTKTHAVRDVTGAGDVFLAAFVYHWLSAKPMNGGARLLFWEGTNIPRSDFSDATRLTMAARFANKVAGISVEYVGTHVVTHEEINNLSTE